MIFNARTLVKWVRFRCLFFCDYYSFVFCAIQLYNIFVVSVCNVVDEGSPIELMYSVA